MKSLKKPLILSFSLLAFTGAYAADDAKKDRNDTQAKPAMSQADKAGASTGASGSASTQSAQADKGKPDQNKDKQATSKDDKATTSASTGASAGSAGAAGGMSAKKLRGMDVVDAQGKDLGEIEEVVLDLSGGRVHAVVIGFGGFLGLGEKQFAFPVSELQPAKDRNKLQLNVDKEKLKDREGFAKGKYPAMTDEYWGRVGGDKAAAGASQAGQKASLVRASDVVGKDVQDQSGKEIGEVEDILLSADRTRIERVVIDVEDAGQAMVEASALSMGAKEGDKLRLNMSRDQIAAQAKPTERQKRTERSDRTSPMGATGGAATGATGAGTSTTRTVPVERPDKPVEAATSKDSGGASTAASGSAAAGGASATKKKSFSELDRDNDGTLSQMEASADADARSSFGKLDKNNDKKLTRSEFEAGSGAAAGASGSASGQSGAGKTGGSSEKPAQTK